MTDCIVTDCHGAVLARGYCGRHYQRWLKYGDAQAPRPPHRDMSGSNNSRWGGGKTKHYLYEVYAEIIARCERPTHKRWDSYGGRGIKVCDRWRHDFWAFVEDMGPRPEGVGPTGRSLYSIERVDNDGNYEPSNCKWATSSEQMKNRRPEAYSGLRMRTPQSLASGAKLTEHEVLEIRRRLANGEVRADLAVEYAVGATTIHNIATGRTWGWLHAA